MRFPMKTIATISITIAALAMSAAHAQDSAGSVERLDPAFDALVGSNVQIEILHEEGDTFFEGPVWHHGAEGGFLTFSDLVGNRIRKWDPRTGALTDYVSPVWTGNDSSSAIHFERDGKSYAQIGPNGETLDGMGRLVFTAMGSGRIMRREAEGTLSVLANAYDGRHLNAPNDLVYASDGALYFTDIRAGLVTADENPPEGVPHTGVYRLKDGVLTLLADDLEAPNGIALSPDESLLYVNDIRVRDVMRYELQADGSIANGRPLIAIPRSDTRAGNPDGMKIDVHGNLWNSGPGGIWIISPQGKHLGTISLPERITNLAWGDDDAMTLYTTGPTMVMRIRVNVAGIRP
nr:MAG: SMP-30/gluconolactonase/LRE family protein [Hyphomicrobiales bacterium]